MPSPYHPAVAMCCTKRLQPGRVCARLKRQIKENGCKTYVTVRRRFSLFAHKSSSSRSSSSPLPWRHRCLSVGKFAHAYHVERVCVCVLSLNGCWKLRLIIWCYLTLVVTVVTHPEDEDTSSPVGCLVAPCAFLRLVESFTHPGLPMATYAVSLFRSLVDN